MMVIMIMITYIQYIYTSEDSQLVHQDWWNSRAEVALFVCLKIFLVRAKKLLCPIHYRDSVLSKSAVFNYVPSVQI